MKLAVCQMKREQAPSVIDPNLCRTFWRHITNVPQEFIFHLLVDKELVIFPIFLHSLIISKSCSEFTPIEAIMADSSLVA